MLGVAGYSGTAGNSVYAHHNDIHDNGVGMATDSVFPGHPGLPQDHARFSHNEVAHGGATGRWPRIGQLR